MSKWTEAKNYEAHKVRAAQRQREISQEGRDIGKPPACVDPEAVERYSQNFRLFCEEVLPAWFAMDWSDDHLRVIQKIENAILRGDVFAIAMPRGSGKTTLTRAAVLWAILCGHRRYAVLVASDKDAAVGLLDPIKVELETNETIFSLWPSVAYPIRALEGKANKAGGQLIGEKRTHILWKSTAIVMPTVQGSKASGAVIKTFGITGRIRGDTYPNPVTGEVMRPDLFVVDDPQTDASANSGTQVSRRLSVINGPILGLAGPGKSIAGFATVTVIVEGDVADQLLDRDLYPDWSGERCQLIYRWPTSDEALKLWEQYGVLRAEGLAAGEGIDEATKLYVANREVMDAGHLAAWEERYIREHGEISAHQHAWNLKFKTPLTFDAEYQNQPRQADSDVERVSAKEIESKTHGQPRNILPAQADLVTAFIDVQGRALYYTVMAWESASFTGYVLDYGTWPKQTGVHYTLRNLNNTLAKQYPRHGQEAQIRAGLCDLLDYFADKTYATTDGQVTQRIQLTGVDAAWGPSTKVVQAVAAERGRSSMLPCFGRGLKPGDNPMSEWRPKPGERKGAFWILRPTVGGGRHLVIDTNTAKTFINSRLNVALGDAGCISLFEPRMRTEHRMIAEHWLAESVDNVSVNGGRSGEVWKLPPSKPDNHFWDTLVGCGVIASVCGAGLPAVAKLTQRRKRRKFNVKF